MLSRGFISGPSSVVAEVAPAAEAFPVLVPLVVLPRDRELVGDA